VVYKVNLPITQITRAATSSINKAVFAFPTRTEIQLLLFIKQDKIMSRIMNA